MDKSEVKRVVETHLPELKRRLGLDHWKVEVEYGPRENTSHSADCGRDCRYTRATIGFDPEKLDDEAAVLDDLRHELFHVVLGPYDLFWWTMTVGLEGDDMTRAERVWQVAVEQSVSALERMYARLDQTKPGGELP